MDNILRLCGIHIRGGGGGHSGSKLLSRWTSYPFQGGLVNLAYVLASVWHQHRNRFFVLSFISAAGEVTFEIRGYSAIGFMRLIEQLIQNLEKTTELLLMQLESRKTTTWEKSDPTHPTLPNLITWQVENLHLIHTFHNFSYANSYALVTCHFCHQILKNRKVVCGNKQYIRIEMGSICLYLIG